MTSVLGLPIAEATAILEREGHIVETQRVRCRKDSDGTAPRVVRQAELDNGTVVLTYALFRLDPPEQ